MRLEKASSKAVRYAIMNWHYSKAVPMVQDAYAVFNDGGEWCGVICYALGANNNIGKPYGLQNGQIAELVRVALNGKQNSTSKALALSIRLFKKKNPLVKLIVSYADEEQGHAGTIYQASNWVFVGDSFATYYRDPMTGKRIHQRDASDSGVVKAFGKLKKCHKKEDLITVKALAKHKYIYPIDKALVPLCKKLAKPYPKKESPSIGQALSGVVESNANF
jgi:hypothetical protein